MNAKVKMAPVRIVGRSLSLAAILFVVAVPVFAHGGFDHVAGNVVKAADNVLTVKTSTGNVDVKLDAKTEITKNGAKAHVADLTPGVRVVIDIPEESKDKVAHAVKIGAAAAGHDHNDHDSHK
jgi:hypothetical protein